MAQRIQVQLIDDLDGGEAAHGTASGPRRIGQSGPGLRRQASDLAQFAGHPDVPRFYGVTPLRRLRAIDFKSPQEAPAAHITAWAAAASRPLNG